MTDNDLLKARITGVWYRLVCETWPRQAEFNAFFMSSFSMALES